MKLFERRWLACFSLALLLVLGACSPDADRAGAASKDAANRAASANRAAEATTVVAEKIMEQLEDAMITAKVTTGLAADRILTASRIQVATRDGVVTLKGPAPTPAARERATEIALNVKGVTSVNNQLSVRSG